VYVRRLQPLLPALPVGQHLGQRLTRPGHDQLDPLVVAGGPEAGELLAGQRDAHEVRADRLGSCDVGPEEPVRRRIRLPRSKGHAGKATLTHNPGE
jgi:hypothetical protein